MSTLLSIDSLCVDIGAARILHEVSLEIAAGEITGLVGASGSGKSMTALAVMGLLPRAALTRGRVTLLGRALESLPEHELRRVRGAQMGMVFQEPMSALNPLIRIGAQVAETVTLHRSVKRREALRLARQALDAVGLDGAELSERYPHELSGGQRQRVAIAAATILSPSLLIADEPTTALDAGSQAEVLRLLIELAREREVGVLLVSHDLAMISAATDRVLVMQEGRVVEKVATADLLSGQRHPYTRALLEAVGTKLPGAWGGRVVAGPPRVGASDRVVDAHRDGGGDATLVLSARDLVREHPQRRRTIGRRPVPVRALDEVSLDVYAGETVGVVGASGSGKSSLLRTVLALDRPQAGEVLLLGKRFAAPRGVVSGVVRGLRRSIQVVLQDPVGSFDPLWPVERLIAEPYHALPLRPSARDVRSNVAAALEQVGLSPADAARLPQEFSGGQRQRIAIARALILRPALIAFDEALSALDVLVRAQILALLGELKSRLGIAYLFVSHDITVMRAIADRVYVMQKGRIVEHGQTAAVLEAPRHPYTQALVAATPMLGVRMARLPRR